MINSRFIIFLLITLVLVNHSYSSNIKTNDIWPQCFQLKINKFNEIKMSSDLSRLLPIAKKTLPILEESMNKYYDDLTCNNITVIRQLDLSDNDTLVNVRNKSSNREKVFIKKALESTNLQLSQSDPIVETTYRLNGTIEEKKVSDIKGLFSIGQTAGGEYITILIDVKMYGNRISFETHNPIVYTEVLSNIGTPTKQVQDGYYGIEIFQKNKSQEVLIKVARNGVLKRESMFEYLNNYFQNQCPPLSEIHKKHFEP